MGLSEAIDGIDLVNGEDPTHVLADGLQVPAELIYGRRMTAVLGELYPEASEALQLAVRAQHIRRWQVPRSSYPMNRAGYLAWRSDLKAKHAAWAGEILAGCGYGPAEIDRVGALIRKENLKHDAEAQALEDVAAIVFLKFYAADFAAKHEPNKVKRILAKTFAKMSPHGRSFAATLALPSDVGAMVEAIAGPGTREHAVADDAVPRTGVVLVAHGDRAGDAPNANLIAQAAEVRALADVGVVVAGVLKGEPSLESALDGLVARGAAEILVYPLFMADGYFVKKVLAERLQESPYADRLRVLPPLGLDPRMPRLVQQLSLETARRVGFEPSACRLVVAGHGSKIGPASADATRKVAQQIADNGAFGEVEAAFLEEDPTVVDVLARSTLPTVVAGLFFGDGLHAGEDVPQAISDASGPIAYTGAIGASDRVTGLIADALSAAVDRK